MADKKIVVFGATGAQGGGLVHSILNDAEKEFSVRAVTRNPDSDSAKALKEAGAEIIQANIDNYEKHINDNNAVGEEQYQRVDRGCP